MLVRSIQVNQEQTVKLYFYYNDNSLQEDIVKNRKFNVLIIGAGVAGMSAACKLNENQQSFAIIEKSNSVGGLAKTYRIKEGDLEFYTDNGPHLFSYGEGEVSSFISKIIPKDQTIPIQLKEKIVVNGKILNFPVSAKQMLRMFGLPFIVRAILDYSIRLIQYKLLKKPVSNFSSFVVANLGKTLANVTTISYLKKIFGIPAEELHVDLATERFNFLSISLFIKDYLKDAFFPQRRGLNIQEKIIMYPKSGIGLFSEIIQTQIKEAGHPIFLNSYLKKLIHNSSNQFTHAVISLNGKEEVFDFDYIIESIPVDDLIQLISPSPPQHVIDAALKLPYRDQVYLFITLDTERVSEEHSFYFADTNVPFCRVTEMKNFDSQMSPPGKTSLLVEFFCNKGDKISVMTKDDLLQLALPFLEKYCHLNRKHIRNFYIFPLYKAYPLYNLEYKKNLDIIMTYLNSFNNLSYIGRTGKFKYISQPSSIRMGINAAKKSTELLTQQENNFQLQ